MVWYAAGVIFTRFRVTSIEFIHIKKSLKVTPYMQIFVVKVLYCIFYTMLEKLIVIVLCFIWNFVSYSFFDKRNAGFFISLSI